ncbi:MAG: PAS domain S-box protein [Polyangiaceae bacterium]|nr:PAS domain S-box protein [Polyangiaceae bacterium]MCW5792089.1 PAS domain S-box protein [Polyangiaceae bacterium]
MSVLIISGDEDAARALRSALSRAGTLAHWTSTVEDARQLLAVKPALVVVADTDVPHISALLDELTEEHPWLRVYLTADPDGIVPRLMAPLLVKPFDAAQLAELLQRDVELASLDRGQRSLRAHANDLALLVEATFEAIIGLGEGGVVLTWNQGAESLYGYSAEEMVGRSITLLEPGGGLQRRLSAGACQVAEVIRYTRSGQEVLVHLSLAPVPRAPYSSLRYSEVSQDVTARRQLIRELEHTERLAGIGRIAASIAHEINNPLSVITASSSYLKQRAEQTGDDELAETAADMAYASERISGFVQHICGFARRERSAVESAPLNATMSIALRMVKARAEQARVTLHVEPCEGVEVPHDPPRLAQAIVNLLANAIDAAATGEHRVALRVVRSKMAVHLEVEDTGPGFAEGLGDALYEPFVTTKPHGKGTGLGLPITTQIVSDHQGSLHLMNRPEGGVLARLSLPLPSACRPSVLIFEPDSSVRQAMARELDAVRCETCTADNLEDACRILNERPVDVVIAQDTTLTLECAEQLRLAGPAHLLRTSLRREGALTLDICEMRSGEAVGAAVRRLAGGEPSEPRAEPLTERKPGRDDRVR